MAAKRKNSQPPPQIHSSSDDDSSSDEDEEQYVAKSITFQAKTPKATERHDDDDESENDSGSDSDPDPPTKSLAVQQKPSESDEESEEEDEEEEEEEEQEKMENPKSPVKAPETEPEKKKLKPSEPDQSPSKKSASAVSRIWSTDDEMVLLRALVEYHSKNGKLPPTKDYGSFFSSISGSIGFPVTEKQLVNKIQKLRRNFGQKNKKGPNVKISKPHDRAVFEICTKLFQDGIKAPKKGGLLESNNDGDTENVVAGVCKANWSPTISGAGNGAGARPYFHLRSLVEDMINGQQCQSWLKVNDGIALIGESRAQNLEAKIKMLRIDEVKLHAREEKLKAEVFGFLAEGMTDE
jgi:Protein of unknown function, DUF573